MSKYSFKHLDALKTAPADPPKGRLWTGPQGPQGRVPRDYDSKWYRDTASRSGFRPDARTGREPSSSVPEGGSTVPEPGKIPGWLIARFAELAAIKRETNRQAEEMAQRMRKSQLLNETDNFLRANGCRLKAARGGSILK